MKAAETTVLKLLQGSKVFLIPNFQRRYSWRAKEWELLWNDLLRELDVDHSRDAQELEGHFLGSIVLHPAAGAASVLMQHLVIDGQQRLTTILILLAALRDIRAELDPAWDPMEYDSKYLTNPFDPDHPDRLVPTELDRNAYVETLRHRRPTDGIGQAYEFFSKKIRDLSRSSEKSLAQVGETLLLHMLLVEINTSPGDSVNNIFNTLNSKGRPLTAADLVRNELLLHIGEGMGKAAYDQYWTPMERALVVEKRDGFDDREFVTFLWSREVAHDPRVTRQELFSTFERRLRRSLDPLPIVERRSKALEVFKEIHQDHLLFLLLRDPLRYDIEGIEVGASLRMALDRLRRWGSEPSTPLALWLLKQAAYGDIDETEAVESLELLLGFLGRRALAGVPTNLLNRILTPVANRLAHRDNSSVVDSMHKLLSAKGSYWPGDSEVINAVSSQPLYVSAKRHVRFLLGEVERRMSDIELVDTAALEIEHVMPQSLSEEWELDLSEEGFDLDEARAVLHTLGNLTLTGHNPRLSDSRFVDKKAIFRASPLRMNNELAQLERFTPEQIENRSRAMAKLLLAHLPGPTGKQDIEGEIKQSGSSVGDRLETALQAMAEGDWTTDSELVEFLGVEASVVHAAVNGLSPTIARLVRSDEGEVPHWLADDLRKRVLNQQTTSDMRQLIDSTRLGELVRAVEQVLEDDISPVDFELP